MFNQNKKTSIISILQKLPRKNKVHENTYMDNIVTQTCLGNIRLPLFRRFTSDSVTNIILKSI